MAAEVRLPDVLWRPAWHKDALCVHHPDVEFFVDSTGDTGPAKRLCARCPVHDDCLAYALAHPSLDGVWAGTSKRARSRLRRQAARTATPAVSRD